MYCRVEIFNCVSGRSVKLLRAVAFLSCQVCYRIFLCTFHSRMQREIKECPGRMNADRKGCLVIVFLVIDSSIHNPLPNNFPASISASTWFPSFLTFKGNKAFDHSKSSMFAYCSAHLIWFPSFQTFKDNKIFWPLYKIHYWPLSNVPVTFIWLSSFLTFKGNKAFWPRLKFHYWLLFNVPGTSFVFLHS